MTTDGHPPSGISRKDLLKAAAVAAIPAALLAPIVAAPVTASMSPTPFCDDGDETPPQMEGPYFKPNSPRRTSMLDAAGTRLTLTGFVFGITCQPIANALVDFWQADGRGVYDNAGYRFRGHQFTDAQGRYTLTTIVPGLYPGRTRHIHVKVQAPAKPILTTQLYFPGEPRNATDSLFNPELLMTMRTVGNARECTFDFVLNVTGPSPTASPTVSPTSSPPAGGTWVPGKAYAVGDLVTYGGLGYRCQIAHTSMVGWEPPNTPALWVRR